MKILEGLSHYFSFRVLKTARVVFGILAFIGLLSPIPLLDELLFIFFFIVSHLLIREKKAQSAIHSYNDDYEPLQKDISACIRGLSNYIRDNNLDQFDYEILSQIKEIEDIINENFETVRLSTERLKQLAFDPKKYEEKRRDILNRLEGNIEQKERKYLEETLKNLLEYKSGVQKLISKRREILTVTENLFYQIKALHAKLLNKDVEIKKEEPFRKLKKEIDEIIRSVEDIEKAKKETDTIIDNIHEIL